MTSSVRSRLAWPPRLAFLSPHLTHLASNSPPTRIQPPSFLALDLFPHDQVPPLVVPHFPQLTSQLTSGRYLEKLAIPRRTRRTRPLARWLSVWTASLLGKPLVRSLISFPYYAIPKYPLLPLIVTAPNSPAPSTCSLSWTWRRFNKHYFIPDTSFLRYRRRAGLSPAGPLSHSRFPSFFSRHHLGLTYTYIIPLIWPRQGRQPKPTFLPPPLSLHLRAFDLA